jgi:hypothetical protein
MKDEFTCPLFWTLCKLVIHIISCSDRHIHQRFFSNSFSLAKPARAFAFPSANPIAFASLDASWYFCRASSILPSISKNSPRLCVATAQPISHSSSRSGALMAEACARAFAAHCRACSMRMVRGALFVTGKSVGSVDIVMASVAEDGDCWARQEEMLFTVGWLAWSALIAITVKLTKYNAVARLG